MADKRASPSAVAAMRRRYGMKGKASAIGGAIVEELRRRRGEREPESPLPCSMPEERHEVRKAYGQQSQSERYDPAVS